VRRRKRTRWDPDIDPPHVGVAVKDGVVTLSGFVRSFPRKRKAEEGAARINGVKGNANDLKVRLPLNNGRLDPEIAREIDPDRRLRSLVRRTVSRWWSRTAGATLNGEVEWDYRRRRAGDTAMHVSW
jgi:osmotically-inducible protein OsmY